ncbi:hypothetical protein ACQP2Y_33375 [Actinoplanes sp. CA-051413]|uniref:hypothetical protein n=1 Tax=Actinoplanes sp. CA-051413 TaxID=3239899 RepID=UPI003D972DD5
MSADLHSLLKLVHQVTGFLLRLPTDQLAGIADGRLPLTVGGEVEPAPTAPVASSRPTRQAPQPRIQQDTTGDYAEIVEGLRKQETTNDGLAYLAAVRLNGKKLVKNDLLALGRYLNLDMPSSLKVAQIQGRLVDQAAGARRKYEGLRP